jgi:hypothetical protein
MESMFLREYLGDMKIITGLKQSLSLLAVSVLAATVMPTASLAEGDDAPSGDFTVNVYAELEAFGDPCEVESGYASVLIESVSGTLATSQEAAENARFVEVEPEGVVEYSAQSLDDVSVSDVFDLYDMDPSQMPGFEPVTYTNSNASNGTDMLVPSSANISEGISVGVGDTQYLVSSFDPDPDNPGYSIVTAAGASFVAGESYTFSLDVLNLPFFTYNPDSQNMDFYEILPFDMSPIGVIDSVEVSYFSALLQMPRQSISANPYTVSFDADSCNDDETIGLLTATRSDVEFTDPQAGLQSIELELGGDGVPLNEGEFFGHAMLRTNDLYGLDGPSVIPMFFAQTPPQVEVEFGGYFPLYLGYFGAQTYEPLMNIFGDTPAGRFSVTFDHRLYVDAIQYANVGP